MALHGPLDVPINPRKVLRLDIWPLGGHKRLGGPPIACLSGKENH